MLEEGRGLLAKSERLVDAVDRFKAGAGRIDIGIGHGMPGWMRSVGEWPASPLTSIGEYLGAVMALVGAVLCAVVLVETDSQKGILIGKAGAMIKAIGTAARHEVERELGRHVHLDLRVRVRRHWRADDNVLDRLGIT